VTTADRYRRYHAEARHEGLVAALALAATHDPDTVFYGPAGHAVLLAAGEADRTSIAFGARRYPREQAPEEVVGVLTVDDRALLMLRCRYGSAASGTVDRDWSAALVWIRLGVSERLLDRAVSYLGQREAADGGTLLTQQLVRAALADAVLEHLEARTMLEHLAQTQAGQPAADGALGELHGRVTRADRGLLRLLGASGYRTDGPGQEVYASELLADVYATAAPGTAGSPR
jgi:hypothetical protein